MEIRKQSASRIDRYLTCGADYHFYVPLRNNYTLMYALTKSYLCRE